MKKFLMLVLVAVISISILASAGSKKKKKSDDAATDASSEGTGKKMRKDGGPVRDDAKIQAEVEASIAAMPSLKDAGVKAESKDGVVTLTGEEANFAQKGVATKAAKKVGGVKGVNNQLTVAKGARKPGKAKAAADKK